MLLLFRILSKWNQPSKSSDINISLSAPTLNLDSSSHYTNLAFAMTDSVISLGSDLKMPWHDRYRLCGLCSQKVLIVYSIDLYRFAAKLRAIAYRWEISDKFAFHNKDKHD